MKVIAVDNYDRETVADVLICENVNEAYVKEIVEFLQKKYGGDYAYRFYKAVPDDHKLSRGMEDLV